MQEEDHSTANHIETTKKHIFKAQNIPVDPKVVIYAFRIL